MTESKSRPPSFADTMMTTNLAFFKKSTKQDPSQFKKLNYVYVWKHWHLHTVATTRAQDPQEIINPRYVPHNSDDVDIFRAKQISLHSVFVNKLC